MTAAAKLQPAQSSRDRDELLELIRERSFRRGVFKLASGVESDRYFNLKPTMMAPRGAYLAARAFIDVIQSENVDFVGGLEMGAVPIIGALAAVSEIEGRPVKTFLSARPQRRTGRRKSSRGLGQKRAWLKSR